MSKTPGMCALQQNKNDWHLAWNCMLYHVIIPAHLHLESTKFEWWLIELGTQSVTDNRPRLLQAHLLAK